MLYFAVTEAKRDRGRIMSSNEIAELTVLRETFVLKRILTGLTDQMIADAWNEEYGTHVSAAIIRMDRVRILTRMYDEQAEVMGYIRPLLYNRIEQAFRALADKVDSGHLGAIKLWLDAVKDQATLMGANIPVVTKIARTDADGKTLDDAQRAEAILEIIRKARERQLAESSTIDVIDITPERNDRSSFV